MRLPPFCLRRSSGQGDPLRGGLRPALPSSLAPAFGRHDAGSGKFSLPVFAPDWGSAKRGGSPSRIANNGAAPGRAHGTCLQVLSAPFGIHSCTFCGAERQKDSPPPFGLPPSGLLGQRPQSWSWRRGGLTAAKQSASESAGSAGSFLPHGPRKRFCVQTPKGRGPGIPGLWERSTR